MELDLAVSVRAISPEWFSTYVQAVEQLARRVRFREDGTILDAGLPRTEHTTLRLTSGEHLANGSTYAWRHDEPVLRVDELTPELANFESRTANTRSLFRLIGDRKRLLQRISYRLRVDGGPRHERGRVALDIDVPRFLSAAREEAVRIRYDHRLYDATITTWTTNHNGECHLDVDLDWHGHGVLRPLVWFGTMASFGRLEKKVRKAAQTRAAAINNGIARYLDGPPEIAAEQTVRTFLTATGSSSAR